MEGSQENKEKDGCGKSKKDTEKDLSGSPHNSLESGWQPVSCLHQSHCCRGYSNFCGIALFVCGCSSPHISR